MADDKAAFGVFPQMKPKRSKQDPEAAKNVPIDLARGALSGVLGAPGDIESLIRMLPYLSEETFLPTSEDIEKRLPFKSDTPVSKAATGLGQVAGGFYTGRGSPLRAIAAIPGALKHGAQEFAMAAGQSGPRIFIGPNAKTFDGNRAMKAAAMEKKGADPVDIWRATGTFKGADGIWRQEISDTGAKFLTDDERLQRIAENKEKIDQLKAQIAPTKQKDLFPKALTEAKKGARDEISGLRGENKMRERNPRTQGIFAPYIFEHPELYEAYPELRNLIVNTETGGDFRGALNTIPSRGYIPGIMEMDISRTGMRQNPTSTALHEMQHSVQTIEGMHPGGSPTMAYTDPIAHEMLKRERLKMLKATPYEDFVRLGGYTDMEQAGKDYQKYTKDLQKGIDPAYDRHLQQRVAEDYYRLLGGEAEARAAQDRQMLSNKDRLDYFPYNSYDVDPDKVIVKPPREYKQGGVAMSDNPDRMMMELEEQKFGKGGVARGFFSMVDDVAKALTRTKGTGAEFMKEVEKTKGVKPAEIQHRKLDEIKAMPKMTKDQFVKELEKRPPAKLEEKVLGEPSKEAIEKKAEELADYEAKQYAEKYASSMTEQKVLYEEEKRFLLENDMDRLRNDARHEITFARGENRLAQYEKYTMPGGENYREILLQYTPYGDGTPLGNQVRALGYKGDLNDLSPRQLIDLGADSQLVRDWTNAINTYQSSHFKQPNVIAHARVSDRIGPNGEKVLHVEEIQSDWHQAGRKKGYKTEEKAELPEGTKIFAPGSSDSPGQTNQAFTVQIPRSVNGRSLFYGTTEDEAIANARSFIAQPSQSAVPDAPFKKNWHELMMNKVLSDAAEKGYDRVVITPGVQQAERYDLSKQVNKVVWNPETGALGAERVDGGETIKHQGVSKEKLADYIGKEAADRLLKSTPSSGWHMIEGDDLKVGGEGMKGFYDKMLPDYLNTLGKKYGVQVEAETYPVEINKGFLEPKPEGGWTQTPPETKALHSFKITPEMRQEFTEKGFPMYSVAVPVGIGATQMEEPKPVQITDNPDAMMMELGDQHFQVGGIAKSLADTGTKRAAQFAAQRAAKAAEEARRAAIREAAEKELIKPSEALAPHIGKVLGVTEVDRMITNPNIGAFGGIHFPRLQHESLPHADVQAGWGTLTEGPSKRILGAQAQHKGKDVLWTTRIGGPESHRGNEIVFGRILQDFANNLKNNKVSREQIDNINKALNNAMLDPKEKIKMFPSGFDITDPASLSQANTFDKRQMVANVLAGRGAGGMKNRVVDYDKIIEDFTEPMLLDVKTGVVGPRLFQLTGEMINDPTLNPAFPTILKGKDLDVEFKLAPAELMLPEYSKAFKQRKGREMGEWDFRRGLYPTEVITDPMVNRLAIEGMKDGGLIKVKRGKRRAVSR